jgi:hypothetical protein
MILKNNLQMKLPMRSLAGALLMISSWQAQANPLTRPEYLDADRAFLLPTCPRAEALDPSFGSVVPAESTWKRTGGGGPESALEGLAVLAPAIIDGALDALQAWLDERAKAGEASLSFTANGFAAAPPAAKGAGVAGKQCLVLVSGQFGPVEAHKSEPLVDEELKHGEWSKSWLDAMGLRGPPHFYSEIDLVYSPDFAEFRAVPAYLEYRDSNLSKGQKALRDLILGLTFSMSGDAAGATVLALARNVTPGVQITSDLFAGESSPWLPVNESRNTPTRNGQNLLKATLSVQATLIETSQPTGLDRLLSKLLAATRPSVTALVKEAAPPNAKPATPKSD